MSMKKETSKKRKLICYWLNQAPTLKLILTKFMSIHFNCDSTHDNLACITKPITLNYQQIINLKIN